MLVPQTEVIIRKDGAELGRYTVTPGEYVIGREGDIPVEADLVSRRHALLTVNYADWLIEDLGSTNGTQLNGQPVAGATRVWPSQKIQVGAATIELHRLQTEATDGQSLSPHAASVRRYLPPDFLRGSKYAIERPIAQGGMGAILAAQEAGLRRPVAMKVMLESGGESDLVRFIEEAQITGQLQHPNIVPVYELGVDEHDQVFYTMKLVEGITLKKVLELLRAQIPASVEKYPLNTLLTIFLKVCDALAYAHAKRVIHRDLKPENLMLGSFGEVLVMDWGLAKIIGKSAAPERTTARLRSVVLSSRDAGAASTLAGTIMGTPHFMSPEQADGKIDQLDARSDIFSLGVILYQILTLDLPFPGRTVDEVLQKVRRCQPLPPAQAALARATLDKAKIKPEVPSALAAVAMKALSLRTEDRYQSVTDIQREIEAYQGGFATGAEKAGAWKQFTLFVRRNKAASIGVAAVLLIGGTLGTKALVEGRRATAALAELRGTAPTFAAQAGALIEGNKFDEALEKIGFAIRLDPENADYHLVRANTLQALARLHEAAESYHRVLALRGDDASAKANLGFCEKLLVENGGNAELAAPLKTKLLDAILAQKRQADAVPLSRELKRDTDTAETTIKSRLKAILAQPGWDAKKLSRLPDGTFKLDLSGLKVPDLSLLAGLPISNLDVSGFTGVDLTPLRQLPLRSLGMKDIKGGNLDFLRGMKLEAFSIKQSDFSDLSPLAGMPLTYLDLTVATKVTDLSPLRGMPLKTLWMPQAIGVSSIEALRGAPLDFLHIGDTHVENLEPLRGMALHELSMERTPVRDLTPLLGLPLKSLNLSGCASISDLSKLAEIPTLENLLVPSANSDITFLKKLPNLKRLGNQAISAYGESWKGVPLTADFWKKNGERLARQVPMEKQLEKFRQRLIAEGNDPEKVTLWAFNAEGGLKVSVQDLKCSDISELRGVPLTMFVGCSTLRDLSPLTVTVLRDFALFGTTPVTDLSPLRDAPLEHFTMNKSGVRDISILRGKPLTTVTLTGAAVEDVAPLADCPKLEEVVLPGGAKNVELLKRLPKLKYIGYKWDTARNRPDKTAAEFWKEFDAKKAAAPK